MQKTNNLRYVITKQSIHKCAFSERSVEVYYNRYGQEIRLASIKDFTFPVTYVYGVPSAPIETPISFRFLESITFPNIDFKTCRQIEFFFSLAEGLGTLNNIGRLAFGKINENFLMPYMRCFSKLHTLIFGDINKRLSLSRLVPVPWKEDKEEDIKNYIIMPDSLFELRFGNINHRFSFHTSNLVCHYKISTMYFGDINKELVFDMPKELNYLSFGNIEGKIDVLGMSHSMLKIDYGEVNGEESNSAIEKFNKKNLEFEFVIFLIFIKNSSKC